MNARVLPFTPRARRDPNSPEALASIMQRLFPLLPEGLQRAYVQLVLAAIDERPDPPAAAAVHVGGVR